MYVKGNDHQIPLNLNPGYKPMIDGIQQAQDNAKDTWKQEARNLVLWVAQTYKTDFILDQVMRLLEQKGMPPHHPNAFGGIVRKLVSEGLIRPTGAFRASTNKSAHCRMMRVYDYVPVQERGR